MPVPTGLRRSWAMPETRTEIEELAAEVMEYLIHAATSTAPLKGQTVAKTVAGSLDVIFEHAGLNWRREQL